ncbi:MAG: peptide-methionine (S)-S-oxide reductase MsrA [Hyphomicrobium sp.]
MLRLALAASAIALLFAGQPVAITNAPDTVIRVASGPTAIATFGAGCYWCTESDFDKVKGVIETTPGFMGGKTDNPTYSEVSSGTTGHTEVVNVKYDPAIVTYQQLLDHYWVNVDLLDSGGQFCDRGSQYRPAIFVYDDEQKKFAEASKKAIEDSKRFKDPVVVEISAAAAFTPAPDPDFYKTNSVRYKYYRAGCGRDARLKQLWGDKAGH